MRSGNTVQLNISLPKELRDEIERLAEAEDRSISNYVARIIKKHIEDLHIEPPHKKK